MWLLSCRCCCRPVYLHNRHSGHRVSTGSGHRGCRAGTATTEVSLKTFRDDLTSESRVTPSQCRHFAHFRVTPSLNNCVQLLNNVQLFVRHACFL